MAFASVRHPPLTRVRIALAFAAAILADGVQLAAGPFGWPFVDELVDVAAMIATMLTLGFHPLLLPTFVIEALPVIDMVPTWTAAVAAVVILRRRARVPADIHVPQPSDHPQLPR